MDLIKLIVKKLEEVEDSGKLEEIIEKNIISCLEDIVSESFRWSGEAKTSIEEALKGKLGISVAKLNLNRYSKIVHTLVEKHTNNTIVGGLSEKVKASLDELTSPLEKTEYKLSHLMDKFKESLDKSYDGMVEQYLDIGIFVDNDGDHVHVYFNDTEVKARYQCKHSMYIYKGRLSSASMEDKPFNPFMIDFFARDSFQVFLFKLYCNNVSITVDEDDIDPTYYREDYD